MSIFESSVLVVEVLDRAVVDATARLAGRIRAGKWVAMTTVRPWTRWRLDFELGLASVI